MMGHTGAANHAGSDKPGGATQPVHSCTEYACGIVAVAQSNGTADNFAQAIAQVARAHDCGFVYLFHSLTAFLTVVSSIG